MLGSSAVVLQALGAPLQLPGDTVGVTSWLGENAAYAQLTAGESSSISSQVSSLSTQISTLTSSVNGNSTFAQAV